MVGLTRTVRFTVAEPGAASARINGYAGGPSTDQFVAYGELSVTCAGEPDARTGYLVNITRIDQAVRDAGVPLFAGAVGKRVDRVLPGAAREIRDALLPTRVRAVRWHVTPTSSLEALEPDMSTVVLRHRFEFAAAHRLHVPGLSDAQNLETFGKCNNPNGHGHNYVIEPAIAYDAEARRVPPVSVATLESLVEEAILRPFDHKHLNLDTEDFRDGSGLNPTVENIARVCFRRLEPLVAQAWPDVRLRSVTVWETDRTCCIYPG